MLVLSRKTRETIQISDNISVTILRISGNTVRIGIDAPRQIRVIRGELSPHVDVEENDSCNGNPPAVGESAGESSMEDTAAEDGGRRGWHLLEC